MKQEHIDIVADLKGQEHEGEPVIDVTTDRHQCNALESKKQSGLKGGLGSRFVLHVALQWIWRNVNLTNDDSL